MKRGLAAFLPARAPEPAQVAAPAAATAADDEDDPLDAFMSSVHAELSVVKPKPAAVSSAAVAASSAAAGAAPRGFVPQRLDEDEEDAGAGFVKALDARASAHAAGVAATGKAGA